MDEPKTYLIAYDIPDDKRRSGIADILLSYGHRVQASVFVVTARGAKFIRMRDSVLSKLNREEDSLIICDLGQEGTASARMKRYGTAGTHVADNPIVF